MYVCMLYLKYVVACIISVGLAGIKAQVASYINRSANDHHVKHVLVLYVQTCNVSTLMCKQ